MTGRPLYPAHTVTCPWCHAPPGTRCTTPRGRKLTVPSHDARIAAYAAQTGPPPPGAWGAA
jgi:hypothetical protein